MQKKLLENTRNDQDHVAARIVPLVFFLLDSERTDTGPIEESSSHPPEAPQNPGQSWRVALAPGAWCLAPKAPTAFLGRHLP
ncbi:hypothetical protein VTN96DRAFT_1572 [Rasamsonia emersonii]